MFKGLNHEDILQTTGIAALTWFLWCSVKWIMFISGENSTV